LKLKSARRPQAVIVFPAQLGTEEDYEELSSDVAEAAGLKMYTAPLSRLDWPVSGSHKAHPRLALLFIPQKHYDSMFVNIGYCMFSLCFILKVTLLLSLHQIGLLPSLVTKEYITGNLM
jgi:hypothetical protein